MWDVGGENVEEVLEIIGEDSRKTFLSILFRSEAIILLGGVPCEIEEDPVTVIAFHILFKVDLPLLHGLLGFLRGQGTGRIDLDVMSCHDETKQVYPLLHREDRDWRCRPRPWSCQRRRSDQCCHHSDTQREQLLILFFRTWVKAYNLCKIII